MCEIFWVFPGSDGCSCRGQKPSLFFCQTLDSSLKKNKLVEDPHTHIYVCVISFILYLVSIKDTCDRFPIGEYAIYLIIF